MKKTLTKIILMIVAVCMLATSFIGCGAKSNWNKDDVTLKNWGAEVTQGGFVAETENYIYFINGIGNSTAVNTFGTPIKGALMAADKSDLTKTCVVVPKLFSASDYDTGVTIYGDYVYYGTPSTETSASGGVANTDLVFMKTKLDGTETEKFFTVSSLYTEYRIVKGADGDVYIVYFDTDSSSIISYNTVTKTSKEVIKTDDKAESESLDAYTFLNVGDTDSAVVLYTTKIYTQVYNEEDANQAGYSRLTAKYNKVYAYTAGAEDSTLLLSGEGVDTKSYTLSIVNDGYVFYKEKVVADSSEKTFVATISDLVSGISANFKEVKNTTYVAEKTLLIVDLETIYTYADSKIIKTGLLANDNNSKEVVASVANLTQILFINGDYIYFLADGKLSRVKITNVDEDNEFDVNIQRVSSDTVSTNWYAPQMINDLVFYADVSDDGQNYINYIDLASATVEKEVTEETTNSDGTTVEASTIYYLEGNKLISIMADEDFVLSVEAKMNKILGEALDDNNEIELTKVGEEYESAKVKEVREIYDNLTEEQKKLVKEETLQTLKDYEKAIEIANVMLINLPDPTDFVNMTKTEREGYKDGYNVVKSALQSLKNNGDYNYDVITEYVSNNLMFTYQELYNLFDVEED